MLEFHAGVPLAAQGKFTPSFPNESLSHTSFPVNCYFVGVCAYGWSGPAVEGWRSGSILRQTLRRAIAPG